MAIMKHVAKLRRNLGVSGGGPNNRRSATCSTGESVNRSPTKFKSPAKRRRSSLSDEESDNYEVKPELDDQEEDLTAAKNTPDHPPVPTRSQQPRKAKSGAKRHWVDDSSDSEEEGAESTDEGIADTPDTPETVHDPDEHMKTADEARPEADCITVSRPGS